MKFVWLTKKQSKMINSKVSQTLWPIGNMRKYYFMAYVTKTCLVEVRWGRNLVKYFNIRYWEIFFFMLLTLSWSVIILVRILIFCGIIIWKWFKIIYSFSINSNILEFRVIARKKMIEWNFFKYRVDIETII